MEVYNSEIYIWSIYGGGDSDSSISGDSGVSSVSVAVYIHPIPHVSCLQSKLSGMGLIRMEWGLFVQNRVYLYDVKVYLYARPIELLWLLLPY